jgi:hypothetical protein
MHRFREYVRKGKMTIYKVPTELQLADIATKPQPEPLYVSQQEGLMQWEWELMTVDELKQSGSHLRACEVIEQAVSTTLSKNQHANQTVELHLRTKQVRQGT